MVLCDCTGSWNPQATVPGSISAVTFNPFCGARRVGDGADSPPSEADTLGERCESCHNERGWKDTVRALPGEVTRIQVRFAPTDGGDFPFDATAKPGYVWHCHILEHEDNEMMRPYVLTK